MAACTWVKSNRLEPRNLDVETRMGSVSLLCGSILCNPFAFHAVSTSPSARMCHDEDIFPLLLTCLRACFSGLSGLSHRAIETSRQGDRSGKCQLLKRHGDGAWRSVSPAGGWTVSGDCHHSRVVGTERLGEAAGADVCRARLRGAGRGPVSWPGRD